MTCRARYSLRIDDFNGIEDTLDRYDGQNWPEYFFLHHRIAEFDVEQDGRLDILVGCVHVTADSDFGTFHQS